jgi:hypothetical protein
VRIASFWSDLSAGSWTELVSGVGSVAVAAVLGGLALQQGRRANRLAEAALGVRFEATLWSGLQHIQLRCTGPTVWLHSVHGHGQSVDLSNGKAEYTPLGHQQGELLVLADGRPPWMFQADSTMTVRCDWTADATKMNLAKVTVRYSTTQDGEVQSYKVDAEIRDFGKRGV